MNQDFGEIAMSKFFTPVEFDSPDVPGSGENMQSSTVRMLNQAREMTERVDGDIYFSITSGYRTPEHNEAVGGVPNSAHTRGHAADIDISWMTPAQVAASMMALAGVGFRRIGLADNFIHVDNDPQKPTPATWDYTDADHKA